MNSSIVAVDHVDIDGDIIERSSDWAIKVIPYDYHIEFVVKEIVGEHVSGGSDLSGAWLYNGVDGSVSDFDKAEVFLSGSIKWDGCSNWDFHTDECMKHFCGRAQAVGIGALMDHLYQIASERVINYDKSIAEA